MEGSNGAVESSIATDNGVPTVGIHPRQHTAHPLYIIVSTIGIKFSSESLHTMHNTIRHLESCSKVVGSIFDSHCNIKIPWTFPRVHAIFIGD